MQLMNFKPALSWSLGSLGMLGMGFVFGVGLAAPGCGDGGGSDDCAPGSVACVCVGELCATGLTCVSGFCVDLGNGTSAEGNSAEGNSGDGDPGDGDPTDSGDGDPTPVNLCQGLIDCVSAVQPEALSSYVLLYGPEGECYDIAGLTMEDCWAECDAIRKGLAEAFPDEPACGPPNCGDGKLDPDEMCDGEAGCSGTCKYELSTLDCSPVTQVGCDYPDERCTHDIDEWGDAYFTCNSNFGDVPATSGFGEACMAHHQCMDSNAVCFNRPDCIDDYCCVPTCYLGATDEDYGTCPTGYTCTSLEELYQQGGFFWPTGTELVGLCW